MTPACKEEGRVRRRNYGITEGGGNVGEEMRGKEIPQNPHLNV